MTDPSRPADPTLRPWHRRGTDVEDGANNLVLRTHRGTHVWADAALIVEAVNNYDRLRAIEAAARALAEDHACLHDAEPPCALGALHAALYVESIEPSR